MNFTEVNSNKGNAVGCFKRESQFYVGAKGVVREERTTFIIITNMTISCQKENDDLTTALILNW